MAGNSIEKYKKRVRAAVKGLDCCRYSRCTKCPYHKSGCKVALFLEAAELLSDYVIGLKEVSDL